MVILTGICRGGPLDGKVRSHDKRSFRVSGEQVMPASHMEFDGTYYHILPDGPSPGGWAWVPKVKPND